MNRGGGGFRMAARSPERLGLPPLAKRPRPLFASGPPADAPPDLHSAEEEEASSEEVFEQIETEVRRQEREELGEPQPRSVCFGCVFLGERDTGAIPYEEATAIVDMLRESLGRTDLAALVKAVARRYAKLRRTVNARLQPHQQPLPQWEASTILDHLRFHNQDPEVQQIVMLSEVQTLRKSFYDASLERSSKTGKVRGNKEQFALYEKATRLQVFLQGKDASKQAFYSAGAMVDPKGAKQGALSLRGKNLVRYMTTVE